MVQWIECQPANQRVASSVRAHAWVVGQVPGLWARSPVGDTQEATAH